MGPKTKLWKWAITTHTCMKTGIAFAIDSNQVMQMLSNQGIICDNFICESINTDEPIHVLTDTTMKVCMNCGK